MKYRASKLICRKCEMSYPVIGGIPRFLNDAPPDLKLSIEKWNSLYEKQLKTRQYEKDFVAYKNMYFQETYEQLKTSKRFAGSAYLEIGSGPFFMGQLIAKECSVVIGIDITPAALKVAKTMLEKNHIHNYLLIQGDILNLPITSDAIDLIYGGGVIEHFKNTQVCVNELYRVLAKRGVSFNSVPMLNVGSLTYRQVWGNIPNAPIIKQIAEFVHIRLLGSRHMTYGYEFSFMPSTLRKIHKNAGFRKILIDRFRVKLVFEFVPAFLRGTLIRFATNSPLFWPMVKVIAEK